MNLNGASDDRAGKRIVLPHSLCALCVLCGESSSFERQRAPSEGPVRGAGGSGAARCW